MADTFPLDSITCETLENTVSASGDVLRGIEGNPIPLGGHPLANSDEGFQKLLLRIAAKAAERADSASLIQLFCAATREFFQVSGVYFWRRQVGDELIREQADGKLAERFVGLRLLPQQSAVTAEAVRSRRTIFVNQVPATPTFPAARQFEARSMMAAPLVVFDEVIGAVTFLHDSDQEFFDEDLAAKATILAGQLGSLLEATRLGEASREEHRDGALADVRLRPGPNARDESVEHETAVSPALDCENLEHARVSACRRLRHPVRHPRI